MKTRLIESWKRWLTNSFHTPKKSIKVLLTSILVGIPFIVLGMIVYKQRDILLSYKWQFHPQQFVFAFVLFSLSLFMSSMVWGYILNVLSKKLSYKKNIYYYIFSNLAKRIPGTIWYVTTRAQMYTDEGVSLRITTLASGLEMAFIALAGLVTVLLFSMEIINRYQLSPIIFLVLLIIGLTI